MPFFSPQKSQSCADFNHLSPYMTDFHQRRKIPIPDLSTKPEQNWNINCYDTVYLKGCRVVCKPNLRLKLEHLEQIGTENRTEGIKNGECSNVPIYLVKSCMEVKRIG